MNRSVIKIGNSLGITLPPEVLLDLDIKPGDKINISKSNGKYVIDKKERIQVSRDMNIDQEFMDGFESLVKNYDNTLRKLSE